MFANNRLQTLAERSVVQDLCCNCICFGMPAQTWNHQRNQQQPCQGPTKGTGNQPQTRRHATDRGILPDMLSYELLVHACEQLGQTDTQIQSNSNERPPLTMFCIVTGWGRCCPSFNGCRWAWFYRFPLSHNRMTRLEMAQEVNRKM